MNCINNWFIFLWLIVPIIYLWDDYQEKKKHGKIDYSDNFWPQFRLGVVYIMMFSVMVLHIDTIIMYSLYVILSAWFIKDTFFPVIVMKKPPYYLGFSSPMDLFQRIYYT